MLAFAIGVFLIAPASAWTCAGLAGEPLWSLIGPSRPSLVGGHDDRWSQNAIDHFVHRRQVELGLSAADPAVPSLLLRRMHLALTGISPSLPEQDRFAMEADFPDAVDRALDRILASPTYGERMAVWWLDLARYADTHGYHVDSHRDMWRWRDWVVGALNAGMPFDQFTIEQLAGDQLEAPTLDQLIATGFNRNNMVNFENGAIAEEYLAEYAADRAVTTATVWLAQTVQCARCHDHKHDALTQRDFYQLTALFNQLPERGLDGERGNAVPYIAAPTAEQSEKLASLDREMAALRSRMQTFESQTDPSQSAWEREGASRAGTASPPRDTLWRLMLADEIAFVDAAGSQRVCRRSGEVEVVSMQDAKTLLLNGENGVIVDGAPPLPEDGPFTIAFWLMSTTADEGRILSRITEEPTHRGWGIALKRGRIAASFFHDGAGGIAISSTEPLAMRQWQHIVLTADGSGKANGMRLFVNGNSRAVTPERDNLSGGFETSRPVVIGADRDATGMRGLVKDIQVFARSISSAEMAALMGNDPIRDILALRPEQRTPAMRQELRRHFLRITNGEYGRCEATIRDLAAQRERLSKNLVTVMVMRDVVPRRATFVLERGQYTRPTGDPVPPGLSKDKWRATSDVTSRLAFARWLVSDENPLTSRVIVNRLWQLHFGLGLVRTTEDFGTHGAKPTLPDLLDWLAVEWRTSGWDLKRLQRRMLLSATYGQSSSASPEQWRDDPENVLLTRGPRIRLDAEFIRDRALAAGRLLENEIGGPSVQPYQPQGLWEEVSYDPDKFTAQVYVQDHGKNLYRRGLYTFWKRSVPPPALSAFDAPEREVCTVRRSRTNTPLQALVLQNDPAFVEAARIFAERIVREGGDRVEDRIGFAFRVALGRVPSRTERDLFANAFAQQHSAFGKSPDAALQLMTVGESPRDARLPLADVAAWTMLANALFCLDEFLTNE